MRKWVLLGRGPGPRGTGPAVQGYDGRVPPYGDAGRTTARPACRTQSAKTAPNCGVPVVERPELLGATVREPDVVIFVPLEGR